VYRVPEEEYIEKGYWRPLSLGEELSEWSEKYGDNVALVSAEGTITYRELDALVDEYAAGFFSLGIRKGDRVLLQLPNRIAFIAVSFAFFRIGAVPIMGLPANRAADIAALCALAEPVAYVTTDAWGSVEYRPVVEELSRRRLLPRLVITDNGGIAGTIPLESLRVPNSPLIRESPDFRDVAMFLLSGGTTGTPKLIPRRHTDYAYVARAAGERCGLHEGSVYLAALPVAHNFPLCCPGILGTFTYGGKVALAETSAYDEAFQWIAREKVTITALVPVLLQQWLEAAEWEEADLSSLAIVQAGGSPVDSKMAAAVREKLGCALQNVYGTAEGLLCMTAPDDPERIIAGTQGFPLSGDDEVRFVDAQGKDVADGETGEMIVRGPYTIQGYFRNPEVNAKAVTEDGYYRTGDVGRRVEEGRIEVCGRVKDQINRAGEKIAPVEVENMLRQHVAVRDAAVVGVDDAILGERICAFVIAETELKLADMYPFFEKSGLSRYKFPDQFETIDAWPVTSVGKIDKRRLVALAGERQPGKGIF
jgi:yersiniabactin salicyl-AMP ligase